MRVQLESTAKLVELKIGQAWVPARVWQGHTESGIPVHVYITRIAAHRKEDLAEFEAELKEQSAPSPEVEAIPLRLIL
jgi:hypothetical protein